MYHVNPPGIENRVKYTITTRRTTARDMHILADAGYVPIKTHVQRSGCVTVIWATPHLRGFARTYRAYRMTSSRSDGASAEISK